MRCVSWEKPGHEIEDIILELAESYYIRPHHESHVEVVSGLVSGRVKNPPI